MRCPCCDADRPKVISTKSTDDGYNVRRRHCGQCGYRFYTIEHELGPDEQLRYRKATDSYQLLTRRFKEVKADAG
jgi:transcriptional regulator NrdR family protein